ncbi:MAG: hypothetical protein FWH07_02795 [Oscillospiraceae bacterium]|nr:hypothetical protein [Oscillospiraceae bacterium]
MPPSYDHAAPPCTNLNETCGMVVRPFLFFKLILLVGQKSLIFVNSPLANYGVKRLPTLRHDTSPLALANIN